MTTKNARDNRRIEIDFKLPAAWRFDKTANVFVSWCPALDLYSQGTSSEEAMEALRHGIHSFIRVCYKRNILDNFLNDQGYKALNEREAGAARDANRDRIEVTEYDDQWTTDMMEIPIDLETALNAGKLFTGLGSGACPS
jgi:hypothetical protein